MNKKIRRSIVVLLTSFLLVGMFPGSATAIDIIETDETLVGANTVAAVLENANIQVSSESDILVKYKLPDIIETYSVNQNENISLVTVDELIVRTPCSDGNVTELAVKMLDDECNPVDIVIGLYQGESAVIQGGSSNSVITTEVAGWNPIYNDASYKYVVTCGIDYISSTDVENVAINIYIPRSYYVRASSYASTTHNIYMIEVGIRLAGLVYNSLGQRTDEVGYYEHTSYVATPGSGQTHTFMCYDDFRSPTEYGDSYIGCTSHLGEISSFLIAYEITFDNANGTVFEYTYIIDN